jgi:hypothetical protein
MGITGNTRTHEQDLAVSSKALWSFAFFVNFSYDTPQGYGGECSLVLIFGVWTGASATQTILMDALASNRPDNYHFPVR